MSNRQLTSTQIVFSVSGPVHVAGIPGESAVSAACVTLSRAVLPARSLSSFQHRNNLQLNALLEATGCSQPM